MKIIQKSFLLVIIALLSSGSILAQNTINAAKLRTLIVFFDGLRPDYITPENMPNVYAFSKKGSYGKQHHSVFPTVTRVNASSYSTGSYPGTHGLMGNTVYFPQVNKTTGLSTGDFAQLDLIAKATGDHLLTAASLGEILQKNGSKMMVFSSGTTGQALMQNHKVSGGAIINPSLILPESFKSRVMSDIGVVPAGLGKHQWLTDAIIKYGITLDGPLVSAIWYGDPDGSAHSKGIGSPEAMASIKYVDEQFGRILRDLDNKGLSNNFNIIISSDHGFVTDVGKQPALSDFLIQQSLKKDKTSDDVVIAEGSVYVKNHDPAVIKKIVAALQSQEWVGGIFTKGLKKGDKKGAVAGTISLDAIHWDHPERSGDILVDVNWNDSKNSAGYAGTSFARGVAGHGSFSPYEVHIALLASGPSFKKSYEGNLPTSNVDLVPTVLHIHKIAIPAQMDGRVMYELLTEKTPSNAPASVKKETVETVANIPGGTYKLILERTLLGKYAYNDYTRVSRETGETNK